MDSLDPKPRRPLTPEARERQRTGQYKGLLHAAQKRKADNSAHYANNFKHGQMAFDFERSAEAAGESREELRTHLSLLDRTLLMLCRWFGRDATELPPLPLHTNTASPRAPKLVRALALLLWRPLRLLRNQQNWERLAICYRLQQIIRWRKKYGELTVERADKFHWDLDATLENYHWHIGKRLKRIERRFWKVWRMYRGKVGVVTAVIGGRDSGSGTRDSRAPSGDDCPIANHQSEITNPETRVPSPETRSLLQFRGTPHYEQFHPTWLDRIDDLSPEGIGNPFQSPSHALRAQEKRAQSVTVKAPEHWQEHPPRPRRFEMEFSDLPASELIRTPSERELRRMVRAGELTVPGSFEEFLALVEDALGPVAQPLLAVQKKNRGNHSTAKNGCATSQPYLHALAESLWNRMDVFSTRVAELRELLEATLVWQPHRFLQLWLKMLPVEYAYGSVDFFRRTHGPNREDIAWGDDETTPPWRECKQRPAEVLHSEADGRKKHAGELQYALRIWFVAVWHALVPALRGTHKVKVALYEWAVGRFGIREEFLVWRPNLSLAQRETRGERPEWAVRVVTATGKTLVKLSDGHIFEPDK